MLLSEFYDRDAFIETAVAANAAILWWIAGTFLLHDHIFTVHKDV